MSLLPVAGPWITEREIERVTEATRTAWYEGAGEMVRAFESGFASYVGRRFAISLPSCTSGIHLSLAAARVEQGDEVILPDLTWIASSAPVTYVGATPVFVDVDPSTWCIDVDAFERAIGPKTRAVIPVDLYGGMPQLDQLEEIAREKQVIVIEDAAEAIGSELNGRKAGSFGDTSVFSFHGSKTLTTGEGGMVVTDDEHLFERMSVLRDHGRSPGDTTFFNQEVAFKYKMSSLQAALGLAQLERVEELVRKKRDIFSWYSERLDGAPLQMNAEPDGVKNSYWMTTVVWDRLLGLDKAMFVQELRARGIDSRPFFSPLTSLPAYAHLKGARIARGNNPVSYRIGPYGLNLPSALSLTQEDVERVAEAVKDVVGSR